MARLTHRASFAIRPVPPYDFGLTASKPAGWPLFTPMEEYVKGALSTATHVNGVLVGLELSSRGSVEHPGISVNAYTSAALKGKALEEMKASLTRMLGADEDLGEFYRIAKKDRILRIVTKDLYGMHSTYSDTVFPQALLAITLQMAPMKRSNEMMRAIINNYGDVAEFGGKRIRLWPRPDRLARVGAGAMARSCRLGYRAKSISAMSRLVAKGTFPSTEELKRMDLQEAKEKIMELPGIGDYSADIINPNGGFPIDVWFADIFGKLFFGREPKEKRKAIERIKREGIRRWGKWSWMAFFYVVQDLRNLSARMGIRLRLE